MIMMNYFLDWLTDERHLALFPARAVVRNSHQHKYPTHREQDLNESSAFLEWSIIIINSLFLVGIKYICTNSLLTKKTNKSQLLVH